MARVGRNIHVLTANQARKYRKGGNPIANAYGMMDKVRRQAALINPVKPKPTVELEPYDLELEIMKILGIPTPAERK